LASLADAARRRLPLRTRLGVSLLRRSLDQRVTTQRTVEADQVACLHQLRPDQGTLGGVEGALRVEARQERVDAAAIAGFGQLVCVGRRIGIGAGGAELLGDRAAAGERIGDFAEGGLDRFLIGGDRGIALGFG
jgi:hypothetical protein